MAVLLSFGVKPDAMLECFLIVVLSFWKHIPSLVDDLIVPRTGSVGLSAAKKLIKRLFGELLLFLSISWQILFFDSLLVKPFELPSSSSFCSSLHLSFLSSSFSKFLLKIYYLIFLESRIQVVGLVLAFF